MLINVSDHAVVRWLERKRGFDIQAIRTEIAECCRNGVAMGATAVTVGNVKFAIMGNVICTVLRANTATTHKPHIKNRRKARKRVTARIIERLGVEHVD